MNGNANENNADNYKIDNTKTRTSKSFKFKTQIIGSMSNDNNMLGAKVALPSKYLNNCWRSRDLPLINYEIELKLKWRKNCVVSEIYKTPEVSANPNANPPNPFISKNNAKFYVPVVTLSINDIIFLENVKQGFKRTISWNKYRSGRTAQPKNNNLDYLNHPTFRNINRLVVKLVTMILQNILMLDKYYLPLEEIRDFNALIYNKLFFDLSVKNKQGP